jgi:hypothetical protein
VSRCGRFVSESSCWRDRHAGDGHPLAADRVSLVLAMEVARSRRQTGGPARNPPIDPRHEPRQPILALPGSTVNSSNSASMWVRPRSPDIWRDTGDLHRKAGRPSCATTPTGSPQCISLSFRRFRFGARCGHGQRGDGSIEAPALHRAQGRRIGSERNAAHLFASKPFVASWAWWL